MTLSSSVISTLVHAPPASVCQPRHLVAVYRPAILSHTNNSRRPRYSLRSSAALHLHVSVRRRWTSRWGECSNPLTRNLRRNWWWRRLQRGRRSRWIQTNHRISLPSRSFSFGSHSFSLSLESCWCHSIMSGTIYSWSSVLIVVRGRGILGFFALLGTTPKSVSFTPCRTLTVFPAVLGLPTTPALGELTGVGFPFATEH